MTDAIVTPYKNENYQTLFVSLGQGNSFYKLFGSLNMALKHERDSYKQGHFNKTF